MDSTTETNQTEMKFDTVLQLVDGADSSQDALDILPSENAFEEVLAKYHGDSEQSPVSVEPVYKNRVLIAALFLFGGILLGRFAADPRVVTRVVEVPVKANPTEEKKEESITIGLKQPFRELKSTSELDPWKPLNGGLPLPPIDTQRKIAGAITPMSPADFGAGPPTSISGNLPSADGTFTPINPGDPSVSPAQSTESVGNEKQANTPQPSASVQERYVAMNLNGPTPEQGQSSIVSIAGRFGGSSRTFTHVTESGAVEAQGVIVTVPASRYKEAKAAIEALGGASTEGEYEGIASNFVSSIQSPFVARLAKLKEKRKDLLHDFMEDAPLVKQIDEAIDLESRAVSTSRVGGNLKGKVVFRVLLR